jgi:predicted TIM-barrel enzyme
VMADGGLNGALIQTMDRVYSVRDEAEPARVAAMTLLAQGVLAQAQPGFAVGVQIMRHAVSASLAVAKVVGASFVRADGLVGATLSTHGWVAPDPLRIMANRRAIDAFDADLIVDIDSMHYRWADSGETAGSVAKRAISVGADAVCVAHPNADEVLAKISDIRRHVTAARIVLGGFVDHENAGQLLAAADAAFVSSCLMNPEDRDSVDADRVRRLVATIRAHP